MNKIKVFLSSKVLPVFEGLDKKDYDLAKLRHFIKTKLEDELILGERSFKVVLNEEGFEQDFTKDAFDACLTNVEKSDLIIILYSGDAGWAPGKDKQVNGICHEEYLKAVQDHPSMTYGINISKYFSKRKYDPDQKRRNEAFQSDVESFYRFKEYSEAKTVDELQNYVLGLIKGYILSSVDKSFEAKRELDVTNTVFGKTLDWSKMNYSQRNDQLVQIGKEVFKDLLEDTIVIWNSVPDNMSVSDARNFLGRPFLKEHIELVKSPLKKGAVHLIGVYGSATETQVKQLIGYPDLTAIKTSFGYYVWDQTTQIQMFFLLKCINPNSIKTRKQQVANWLRSSKELSNVHKRAKARYNVLEAVNKSIEITRK
jgi:hypothetical protein